MISIAVIGIMVIIIWTVWRCRFKLLLVKKIQRRRILIEGRNNVCNGLSIETKVDKEENDRNTTYDVINETNMIIFECWWMNYSWCKPILLSSANNMCFFWNFTNEHEQFATGRTTRNIQLMKTFFKSQGLNLEDNCIVF